MVRKFTSFPNQLKTIICFSCLSFITVLILFSYTKTSKRYILSLSNGSNLLIDTEGCQVEYIQPWNSIAKKFFKRKPRVKCSATQSLVNLTYVEGEFLKIYNENLSSLIKKGLKCNYSEILRGKDTDFRFKYSNNTFIDLSRTRQINLHKMEFIYFTCKLNGKYVYENYHTYVEKKQTRPVDESKNPHYNILLVGIDSTSRNKLIRTMPRVYDYMINDLEAITMEGFIKVAGYTLGNIGVLLRGEWVQDWKDFKKKPYLDEYNYLFQDFANRGYGTFFIEDDCYTSMFKSSVKGFKKQPTNHWGLPLSCAAARGVMQKKSICFGQKSSVKVMTDNVLQFERAYRDSPWWSHMHQTMWSHGALEGLSAVENDYLSFFKEFKAKNLHENSFIIFHSDHGTRYGDFRQTYVGRHEEHLPFMLIVPPKDFRRKFPTYYNNLRENFNKLTTYFDIHKTLLHVLNLYDDKNFEKKYKKKKGNSLFFLVSKLRTCESAPLKVRDCLCRRQKKISTQSILVKTATSFAVSYMNKMIKDYGKSKLCTSLHLMTINNAYALLKHYKGNNTLSSEELTKKSDSAYARYIITYSVTPSNGTFEAMIGYSFDTKKYTVLETIERVTKYGNESNCVQERNLRGICFCKLKNI